MIYGEYDCATWNQFGGVDPSLNYVWFLSLSATPLARVAWACRHFRRARTSPGAVNFAHQADPVVEESMLTALRRAPGLGRTQNAVGGGQRAVRARTSRTCSWTRPSRAFAARNNVQNWASAPLPTAGPDAHPRRRLVALGPDLEDVAWPVEHRGGRRFGAALLLCGGLRVSG